MQAQHLSDDIDVLLRSHLKSDEPGGAILVEKADSLLFAEGYGLADLNTNEKITRNTVFNTGSISKTFVANGILILAQQGKLQLSDPLTKYFKFEHPEVVSQVSIRHLLSHTSGLPDLRKVSDNIKFYLTAKDVENFDPLLSCSQLNFHPGARFEYSNPAYNGLALIIEKIIGGKWQEFIQRTIFRAAKMKSSTITDGPHPEQGVAHAYVNQGGRFMENDYGEFPTFAAAGNGGIWSSVVELAKYHQAIKHKIFLDAAMIEESQNPYRPENWNSTDDPKVGYGWWSGEAALFETRPFAKHMIFHTGSQGGFRGYFIYIPDEDLLVVALFNRPVEKSLIQEILKILQKHHWGKSS